jgi:hypothetical protein
MESLVLTFDETCAALNSNRSFVNGAVKHGDLESFVIGKRRFFKREKVEKFVDFLEERSKAGNPVSYGARDGREESAPRANAKRVAIRR